MPLMSSRLSQSGSSSNPSHSIYRSQLGWQLKLLDWYWETPPPTEVPDKIGGLGWVVWQKGTAAIPLFLPTVASASGKPHKWLILAHGRASSAYISTVKPVT